jgi:hypothetical protein
MLRKVANERKYTCAAAVRAVGATASASSRERRATVGAACSNTCEPSFPLADEEDDDFCFLALVKSFFFWSAPALLSFIAPTCVAALQCVRKKEARNFGREKCQVVEISGFSHILKKKSGKYL